jgi:hypothetical protein
VSIFEELRALDNRDEARSLTFESTGLPLWLYIRWIAFAAAQDKAFDLQTGFAPAPPATRRQRAELLLRSQLQGPSSAGRQFDIVFVSSSGGLVLKRDERWFDRINDYYVVEEPERTLVLDMALNGAYKRPRFPSHVRCYDTFDIRSGIRARLERPASRDLESIDHIVRFVREEFPVELDGGTLEQVRATLLHWAVRLRHLRASWRKFFEQTRPRVLFIEGGSYGALAHLCAWADDAGIATAELQHGVISRVHLAYNYGDGASEIGRFLPRHLLLYGEVWKRETRTPSELTTIGCAHFSENAPPRAANSSGPILVVSQGICTELMVNLTTALAQRYPNRKLVFRLHPGEVAFRERYASLSTLSNVEVSASGDIYKLFAAAGMVVGHSSTALIEAAGIGLPVFIYNDESARGTIPSNAGTWFNTSDELLDLVASPRASSFTAADFFAPAWRENYRTFLARVS